MTRLMIKATHLPIGKPIAKQDDIINNLRKLYFGMHTCIR